MLADYLINRPFLEKLYDRIFELAGTILRRATAAGADMIGFEVIDPIQPDCLDPAEIKRLYGDRITLHGCGSLQRTLPFGSPEDCRQEVIGLLHRCSGSGGPVLRVSNNIGYDVPVENVVAWYETVRDYRL